MHLNICIENADFEDFLAIHSKIEKLFDIIDNKSKMIVASPPIDLDAKDEEKNVLTA